MKTIVTFEVETPPDAPVQDYARAIDEARADLARRGYKVRLAGCRLAPVPGRGRR